MMRKDRALLRRRRKADDVVILHLVDAWNLLVEHFWQHRADGLARDGERGIHLRAEMRRLRCAWT